MGNTRAGVRQPSGLEATCVVANLDLDGAVEHAIDFVGPVVCMRFLHLPGLEAVDVTEHARRVEDVALGHLLGRESDLLLQSRKRGHCVYLPTATAIVASVSRIVNHDIPTIRLIILARRFSGLLVDFVTPVVLANDAVSDPHRDVHPEEQDEEREAELPGEELSETLEVRASEALLHARDAPGARHQHDPEEPDGDGIVGPKDPGDLPAAAKRVCDAPGARHREPREPRGRAQVEPGRDEVSPEQHA